MYKKLFVLFTLLLAACSTQIEETIESPDGKIKVEFLMLAGAPHYAVEYDGSIVVMRSKLGFKMRGQEDLLAGFEIESVEHASFDEVWKPVWGQFSEIRNNYNEMTIHLVEAEASQRKLDVIFRAYDDGMAFRYNFPSQAAFKELRIGAEETEFRFPSDHKAWWIPGDYNSYEHVFRNSGVSEIDSANTPVTLEVNDSLYLSVHEAALTDYSGMTLVPGEGEYTLKSKLVPWPDGDAVKGELPFRSPWRTVQIARRPGALIESGLILNLNEPNKLDDVSWIEPMKYMGIWWSHHIDKTTFGAERRGATTKEAKRYIDFASKNGIRGMLVEGWNTDWDSWGEPGAFNFTESNPDYNLEEVVEYAKSKNVALVMHNETGGDVKSYEDQVDAAFDLYEKLGIHALKTGYARGEGLIPENQFRHGQWMVRHYRSILEKAAEHKIMIDAHEPIKPTGISRTYPNMMTREGVRGTEWNAWSEGNPPEHETILPFTRMLGGPLDYTPGIFDLTYDEYKDKERVHTTIAKQLAMFVVLFSPMQMAAGLPENYEGHPMFQFIKDVPVTWDETRVLNGKIGDYVTIARRKGNDWYIGSLTDEEGRELTINLGFLEDGKKYTAQIYVDAPDSDQETNPQAYEISEKEFTPGQDYTIVLAPGGGQAVRIVPVSE